MGYGEGAIGTSGKIVVAQLKLANTKAQEEAEKTELFSWRGEILCYDWGRGGVHSVEEGRLAGMLLSYAERVVDDVKQGKITTAAEAAKQIEGMLEKIMSEKAKGVKFNSNLQYVKFSATEIANLMNSFSAYLNGDYSNEFPIVCVSNTETQLHSSEGRKGVLDSASVADFVSQVGKKLADWLTAYKVTR